MSLEIFLRNKVDDVEKFGMYNVATDTVRAWIDTYNADPKYIDVCDCSKYVKQKQYKRFKKLLNPVNTFRLRHHHRDTDNTQQLFI